MVVYPGYKYCRYSSLSVLALSSRFDGQRLNLVDRVISRPLSVLALSSRFDGQFELSDLTFYIGTFSTRSVESF